MVGFALLRGASRQPYARSLRSPLFGPCAPHVAGSWRQAGGGPAAASASAQAAPLPGLTGRGAGGTRDAQGLISPLRLRCCGGAARHPSAVGQSASMTPPLGGARGHTSAPPPPARPPSPSRLSSATEPAGAWTSLSARQSCRSLTATTLIWRARARAASRAPPATCTWTTRLFLASPRRAMTSWTCWTWRLGCGRTAASVARCFVRRRRMGWS
ncbi:hypothetical protein I4F81_012521 [Pyropia yezoensis]|uniref:Uncharacterized protein n=1 Tax=Pyropia yezoensis TaxID=2788 RepID=A0ACC3CJJ4_PYRYE|nr:hypothetical protein I4F81_012521 [Neopyropia yezoensis]